jgi:hypothetical protein
MKKLLLYILVLIQLFLLYSCEKENNDSAEKKHYLSRVITNDKLSKDFIYDANKRVIQSNSYDTSGNISLYSTFDYANGHLQLERIHKSGEVLASRTFRFDEKNNLIRFNFCRADSAIITNYIIYNYNEQNQCVKEEHYYDDSLYFTVLHDYQSENMRFSGYYINDSLVGTINNTFDRKQHPAKYVSSMPYILEQQNIVSATSPGNVSGIVWLQLGENFAAYYLLCEYSYEYNDDNYPVKETSTPYAAFYSVTVTEYEYIE